MASNNSKGALPYGFQGLPGQVGHNGGAKADPMMDWFYSLGAPVFSKGGGGAQTRSIHEDMFQNTLRTGASPDAASAAAAALAASSGNAAKTPMGKFNLPDWYWTWMLSQGISGGVPDLTTSPQGLLGE